MKRLYSVVLILIAFVMINCRSSSNGKDFKGWHFHICSAETEANKIWFEVSGTKNNSKYKSERVKWTSKKGDFVGVPASLRKLDDLNVSIRTNKKKRARVCILYNDHVVKTVEVSGKETTQVSKDNSDNCPC